MLLPAVASVTRRERARLPRHIQGGEPICLLERAPMTLDYIHTCDALTLLKALPVHSIDLILTDPPYNGVKDDAWDNQWKTDADYLAWLQQLLAQFRRVLKPNGSLYLFASPRMAARVEVAVSDYLSVLNSIVWVKPDAAGAEKGIDTLRTYALQSERIVFAEQTISEDAFQEAMSESAYHSVQRDIKTSLFGDYLNTEFQRAKVNRREIAALFPSASGGLTGCVSNWILGYNIPTQIQYGKIKARLNKDGGDYLQREYAELRQVYEGQLCQHDDLRRQHEALQAKFQALRRPFCVERETDHTDIWSFSPVMGYPGKHPCEKPLEMMEHIIKASTRHGAVVLDCFAGSGATLDAARRLGRKFIGCDFSEHWCKEARKRVTTPYMRPMWIDTPEATTVPVIAPPVQRSMFALATP